MSRMVVSGSPARTAVSIAAAKPLIDADTVGRDAHEIGDARLRIAARASHGFDDVLVARLLKAQRDRQLAIDSREGKVAELLADLAAALVPSVKCHAVHPRGL